MLGAVHWKVPLRSPSPTYSHARTSPASARSLPSRLYAQLRAHLLAIGLALLLGSSLLTFILVAIFAPLAIPAPLPFSIRPYRLPLSPDDKAAWARLSPAHRRRELVSAYDAKGTQACLGLKLGSVDIAAYRAELEGFGETYLRVSGSGAEDVEMMLRSVVGQLGSEETDVPLLDARVRPPALPRKIYTTAASSEPHLAPEFGSWADLNRGWEVQYFSDGGIRWWLERALGVDAEGDDAQSQDAERMLPALFDEFERLPRGVLKADFFRYLIILLHGGGCGCISKTGPPP